jgi:hypothetical protein
MENQKLFFVLSSINKRFGTVKNILRADDYFTFDHILNKEDEDQIDNEPEHITIFASLENANICFTADFMFGNPPVKALKSFKFNLEKAYNDPSELRKLASMLKAFANDNLIDLHNEIGLDAGEMPDFKVNILEWEKAKGR